MLKKASRIIVSSLLSLLIVYMGVGFAMVYCTHHGDVMSMTYAQESEHGSKDCQKPMGNCMKVMVSKLSPTSMSQVLHFDFHAFQPVVFVNDFSNMLFMPVSYPINRQIVELNPHGPPKVWLHKINVLII